MLDESDITLPCFKVPKKEDKSRFITDARKINAVLETVMPTPAMPLPNIQDVVRLIAAHKFRASIDAKSFFFQFPLRSRKLRRLFGIRIAAKRGTFLRAVLAALPIGCSFAPTCAQAVANLILTEWRSRTKEIVVVATVWVTTSFF